MPKKSSSKEPTLKELREMAKEKSIKGYSKMNKEELMEKLKVKKTSKKKTHSKEDCDKWLANPLVNPLTGRKIQRGKGVYLTLEKDCKGSSKKNSEKQDCEKWFKNPLVNPLTGRKIQEGKSAYLKLKKNCEKYKKRKDVLNLPQEMKEEILDFIPLRDLPMGRKPKQQFDEYFERRKSNRKNEEAKEVIDYVKKVMKEFDVQEEKPDKWQYFFKNNKTEFGLGRFTTVTPENNESDFLNDILTAVNYDGEHNEIINGFIVEIFNWDELYMITVHLENGDREIYQKVVDYFTQRHSVFEKLND
jgi:hypothetical protein